MVIEFAPGGTVINAPGDWKVPVGDASNLPVEDELATFTVMVPTAGTGLFAGFCSWIVIGVDA